MEAIREYLNSIFANLPATDDVVKAKQELTTMMEDKLGELMAEGKSEAEAVEIIKEEFGNLDEIADTLGLRRDDNSENYRRYVDIEEARDYISAHAISQFMLGVGVMFCILCVVGPILSEGLAGFFRIGVLTRMVSAISIASLFIFVAVGVGLIVLSSARKREWRFLEDELCTIDETTEAYVKSELDSHQVTKGLTLAAGIVLCCLSVLPTVLLEIIFSNEFITENLAPSLLFVVAGLGVCLIISSSGKTGACRRLLKLNSRESIDEALDDDDDEIAHAHKTDSRSTGIGTERTASFEAGSIIDNWEKETTKAVDAIRAAKAETMDEIKAARVETMDEIRVKKFKKELKKELRKELKKDKVYRSPNGRELTPLMDTVLSNYWAIVFAIFMIGGFVFGLWGRIWLIWIIAPIVHSYLKKSYGLK